VLRLGAGEGRIRAALYASGAVREEAARDDGGWDIDVEMSGRALRRLCGTEAGPARSHDAPAGGLG
jgi:hypothetical protein